MEDLVAEDQNLLALLALGYVPRWDLFAARESSVFGDALRVFVDDFVLAAGLAFEVHHVESFLPHRLDY